ncbi:hypothetical protein EST38_g3012 [Candolleomyces aberdarensis]|uniref:MYND-type domain-containing protein n=1 Tax=Candolleomyces aberdarensis TaxID=2316362 RepID=A0A4Q2DT58_9AGAR|nr:hypothetical protein EST38_g3012 [Candolleomyces aberdarensis]
MSYPGGTTEKLLDSAKSPANIEALVQVSLNLTPEDFNLDVLKVFLHHLSPEIKSIPQHVKPDQVEDFRALRIRAAALSASRGLPAILRATQPLKPSVRKEVANEILPSLEGILEWYERILGHPVAGNLSQHAELDARNPTLMCATLRGFMTLDPRLERVLMSSYTAASFAISAFTARDMQGKPYISFEDFSHIHPTIDCLQTFLYYDNSRRMVFDFIGDSTRESEALRTQVINCFIDRCEYIKNLDYDAVSTQLKNSPMRLPGLKQTSPSMAPIMTLKQLLSAAKDLFQNPTVQRAFLESSFLKAFCQALSAWLLDRTPKRREPEFVKEGFALVYQSLWLLGNEGTTRNRLCFRAFESMIHGGMFSLVTQALKTILDADADRDWELGNTLTFIVHTFKSHCQYPGAASFISQFYLGGNVKQMEQSITERSQMNGMYWMRLNLEIALAGDIAAENEAGIIPLCDNLKCNKRGNNRQYNPSKRCSGCHAVVYCSNSCQKKDWNALHREECKHAEVDYKRVDQDRKGYSLKLRYFQTLFAYRMVTVESFYSDWEATLPLPPTRVPRVMFMDGWDSTSPTLAEYPNLHRLEAKPPMSLGVLVAPTNGPVKTHYFDERAGRLIREHYLEGGARRGTQLVEWVFRFGDKEVFVLVKMKEAFRPSGNSTEKSFNLVSSVARFKHLADTWEALRLPARSGVLGDAEADNTIGIHDVYPPRKPVLSGPSANLNRRINVVSLSESKVTPKTISAFDKSESPILGLAAGHTRNGKLSALAICDGSSAIIVDFKGGAGKSSSKGKQGTPDSSGSGPDSSNAAGANSSGRKLIEEKLLGQAANTVLAAFDMGPLALSLYTDFGISVSNAIDVQSTFPELGKSPYAVVEAALRHAQLDKVKPSAERIGSEFLNTTYESIELNCRKELVCRAWLAHYLIDVCLDDQAREEVKKVNTKGIPPEFLKIIAKICTDAHRLSLGESPTTKHRIGNVRNEDGVTHIDAAAYKHKFRGTNKSGRIVAENERGRFAIHTAIDNVKNGSGAVQSVINANTTIISTETTGYDRPTLAASRRAKIILRVLQGKEDIFVDNPWIRNIWFSPDGTLVWPEEWSSPISPTSRLPPDTYTYELPKLNPSQQIAVNSMLSTKDSYRCVIVQGPPGTGKTSVIAAYVILAARRGYDGIWLIAQSNVAVKNIALKLLKVGYQDWKILVAKEFHNGWHEHLYTEDTRFDGHLLISYRFKKIRRRDLEGCRVILSTLSMLSNIYIHKFTRHIPMKTLIVDEASQIEVGSYVPAFTAFPSLRKVCWIGDNKQLPPHGQEQLEELQSIFEVPHLEKHVIFLDTQYRMPPEIGGIISDAIYGSKLKSNPLHPVTSDTISCYFINVPQGRESKAETSWKNIAEQAVVLKLAQHLQEADMAYKIITPYEGQTTDKCFNVDSFQGNEEDYIVISLVRSRELGFLDNLRRTNVMLTRCKKGMFIITSRKFMDGVGGNSLAGKLLSCLEDRLGDRVWLTEEQIDQGQISNI